MPETGLLTRENILDALKYITGGGITLIGILLKERYMNRKAIFTKKVSVEHLALSHKSDHLGDIKILYNGNETANLHLVTAEIINTSRKDFTDLKFECSVPNSCRIYISTGQLVHSGIYKDLLLTPEYSAIFDNLKAQIKEHGNAVLEHDKKLADEGLFLSTNKQFSVPIIQSGSKVAFQFLVEKFEESIHLNVFVPHADIRVVPAEDDAERKEQQRKWEMWGGGLVCIIWAWPIYYYSPSIKVAVTLMLINVFLASIFILPIYHFLRWFKIINKE